jgi:hypothetical protein
MSSVGISGLKPPTSTTALRRSAATTPETVTTRPQMRCARRSRLMIDENSIACSRARKVSVLRTRGLPVTAATRGASKCGTMWRSICASGSASASRHIRISPRASGIASLSAIALPSLTSLRTRRRRGSARSGASASSVPSLEPSSTTMTSNRG